MKQLLILVCLVFGTMIQGQKAHHIVMPEPSVATEIGMQSNSGSDVKSSVKEYWQKGVDTVKDFFAGKSVWTIVMLGVAVIVCVVLCFAIGFILLYFIIRCFVSFILFMTDIFD